MRHLWKRLTCSLSRATLIIEGTMRLQIFLVEYRDEHADKEIIVNERQLPIEDINNSETEVMVVGNDVRACGNISNTERIERLIGMKLRDDLIISLMDHDMNRPRKDEWVEDEHKYITRN